MSSLFKKFKFAFMGLIYAVQDKSICLQLILGGCVVLFGIFFRFSVQEWMWILSCILFVLMSEIWNTCIERLCDLIDLQMNPKIKIIKDLSAGCVLLASLYSIVIGCCILKGVLR